MNDEIDKTASHVQAVAEETHAVQPAIPTRQCLIEQGLEPFTIIIIGATGDLTSRKLMPALFNLYRNDLLPLRFRIVGCGRTKLSDPDFRNRMNAALSAAGNMDPSKWPSFSEFLCYRSIGYDDASSFIRLSEDLKELDGEHQTGGNRIFYLAIPPTLYQTVVRMIGQSGLSVENRDRPGWSRIVVEKPFGRDLETAMDLDRSIHEYFQERRIFRIDHYLAKETVQNILMFRFANSIFEPIWNRRYIDSIRITVAESLGVGHRAGYYETAGVLRDMFQNHMMQLLSLIAMEPPSLFEAERVRDEKSKTYRSLRPFPVENLNDYLVLGQYGAGTINGEKVPAYREEPGVKPDSLTPTFARMKVFIDNWRWQGVPFYLTSGKRMCRKLTEIVVRFKGIPHSIFRHVIGEDIMANRLTLGIYPDEKITLTFQTKNPGARVCLRPVTMDFFYHPNTSGPFPEAYEKVLIDCIIGDQMLFWRQDGVELCWAFLTPILMECETCDDRSESLHFYESGSRGPRILKNR